MAMVGKNKKKYRILSIDGGGMKGVFTAYAIWKLEEEYNIKIIDHFDMIVGTSTGALIATGILCGKSGKEIYDSYISPENKIFAYKKTFKQYIKSTFFASYFDIGFYEYLDETFPNHTLNSLYNSSGKKDFAFFASNFTKAKPVVYGSPSMKNFGNNKEILLSKVLRSSIASPFYFEPLEDEETKNLILDGGLWANNPSLVGVNLAISELGIKQEQIEVLSFGQTFTSDLDFTFGTGVEVIKSPMKNQFVQLLLSTLTLNQNSQNIFVKNLLGNKLYRYEPEEKLTKISIDKVSQKFINYTKIHWIKNKDSLSKFILTGE